LHIEDAEHDRLAFRTLLAKADFAGSIDVAIDVAQAKKWMTEKNFALAVVDFRLPDGDGLEILSWAQDHVVEKPVFVFMTSLDEEKMGLQALKLGAHDYCVKGEDNPASFRKKINFAFERERLSRDLEKANKRLQMLGQIEAINAVGVKIAHLFNNYLAIILVNLEMLENKLAGAPEYARYLEAIRSGGERASATLKEFLHSSRPSPDDFIDIDIHAWLRERQGKFASRLNSSLKLEMNLCDQAPRLHLEPQMLQTAIEHLLENANDAMEGKTGTITLKTTYGKLNPEDGPSTSYFVISVIDTGSGIKGEYKKSLFKAGFSTKPDFRGFGLGLLMVHYTLNVHNGLVTVDSDEAKGTTVSLFFPMN